MKTKDSDPEFIVTVTLIVADISRSVSFYRDVLGATVLREGEPASGFYLIETGSVVLEGKAEDGTTVVIDTVTAGEPLGWSWLFPPYLWTFDARATEPCSAICFSGLLLRQHRDDDLTFSHELHNRVSEVMVRRLQAARNKLVAHR